jgi:uncharacterized protein (DUF1499 family)
MREIGSWTLARGVAMWWKILLIVLILIILGWAATMTILSATARRPDNLGVRNGKLAPCPDTPNCVSSQATDDAHRMDPIPFEGNADETMVRLKAVLAARPRTTIVSADGDYLHAECVSMLFRFVDDVEFLVDPDAKVIHFRSASRVGRSDLGVNRKRMEAIRKDFESLPVARP